MANNDKNKRTYTKDMLVKDVSKECEKDKKTVREVYDALEDKVFNLLSSTNDEESVAVKLFEGIVLDSVYVPEHDKINNLTGETIIAKGKIKPKARITRSYCDKINRNDN